MCVVSSRWWMEVVGAVVVVITIVLAVVGRGCGWTAAGEAWCRSSHAPPPVDSPYLLFPKVSLKNSVCVCVQ